MIPALPPSTAGCQCSATHQLLRTSCGSDEERVRNPPPLLGGGPESPDSLEEAPNQHRHFWAAHTQRSKVRIFYIKEERSLELN